MRILAPNIILSTCELIIEEHNDIEGAFSLLTQVEKEMEEGKSEIQESKMGWVKNIKETRKG